MSIVDKEQRLTNCWHCLTCVQSPVPCPHCSGVVFCSSACRDSALNTYHPCECGYTDLLYQANLGAWHLAFRVVTSRPWSWWSEDIDQWLGHDEKMGVQTRDETVYRSEDIKTFHNLVTHDGGDHKQAPELMMQCHVVVFLVRLLTQVGYLSAGDSGEFSDESIKCGRILHHLMRAAYYNTHETTHLLSQPDFSQSTAVRIGRQTNPSLALINHSCDPNYRRVSRGTVTYGFATKPISKFDTFSYLYTTTVKDDIENYDQQTSTLTSF